MNKQTLISLIEKYYLNSIIEKVKWNVNNKVVNIQFISPNKDMLGSVMADIVMNDCDIAIFDTSQLLKLINITEQFVVLDVNKQGKISTKLLVSDNEFNLEYALADLMLIPKLPKLEEPTYDFTFTVDLALIDKFIKAKKAVETEVFLIQSQKDFTGANVIEFTIGKDNNHSNKVKFSIPALTSGESSSAKLYFNADYVKEIFSANKDVVEGICYVSEQGLMKLKFEGKDKQYSNYIIIAKE